MSHSRLTCVGLAVLFVLAFVLFSETYSYVLGFQSKTNDCFFLFHAPFFFEFWDHPAGLIRYGGRFLGQFHHQGWAGALIVAACVTCFGLLFYRVLKKRGEATPVSRTLLPCVLLLALHTSTLWLLQDTLGLGMACVFFLGYLSLPKTIPRRVYAVPATLVLYLVAGVYFWFFVVWGALSSWLDTTGRSRWRFPVFLILFGSSLPLVAWRWLFPIPLRGAWFCPLLFGSPFRTGSPQQTMVGFTTDCVLAALLAVLLVLIPFWSRLFQNTRLGDFWQLPDERRSRLALAGAIAVLGVLLHLVRYDAPLAKVLACRRLYEQRQWDALLEEARDNPYKDYRVQFMTNFALYQQGNLLDRMFCYPQPWGTRGLFLNFSGRQVVSAREDDTFYGMYNSDLLYEMGHANYAFRHAYNKMCLHGRTGETMARVAQCSMVNGNYAMAAKYLNLLGKTVFHRDFARRYQRILADRDTATKEFAALRARLPTVDGFGHPTKHFITLLESKADNRMALEYLMAWLLLDKTSESLESVCVDVEHLRRVGYTRLPRHCQEAMLLQAKMTRAPVDPRGFRHDEPIVARVDEFWDDMSGRGTWLDKETAEALYGDSYMFYWYFATISTATPDESEPVERFRVTPSHQ
ncbi:MAG: DUF6057 family protein [Planctomycetota bacterium]